LASTVWEEPKTVRRASERKIEIPLLALLRYDVAFLSVTDLMRWKRGESKGDFALRVNSDPLDPRQFVFPAVLVSVSSQTGVVLKLFAIFFLTYFLSLVCFPHGRRPQSYWAGPFLERGQTW
jgi:hypothetical protein